MAGWPLGVFCVSTSRGDVAITYDDGPHPVQTNRILDVLSEFGAKATFFVMAPLAAAHQEVVRRIVADGHEVGLHGETHRSLLSLTNREVIASLRRSKEQVEDAAGVAVTLFRPPYGHHSLTHGLAVRALGMRMILWSALADDWIDVPAEVVASRAIEGLYPGSILLLHDNRADPETLQPGEFLPTFERSAVLRGILNHLQTEGYRSVTVSELTARHRPVKSVDRRFMDRRAAARTW